MGTRIERSVVIYGVLKTAMMRIKTMPAYTQEVMKVVRSTDSRTYVSGLIAGVSQPLLLISNTTHQGYASPTMTMSLFAWPWMTTYNEG